MKQPEGFGDGTQCICQLIKMLYGLKQSGREWNIEFDKHIRCHNFKCLRSDPCAYIRIENNDVVIITVWVDDLLLFAGSKKVIEETKKDLCSEWEITNMREPSKIIGIEIKRSDNALSISQKKNIESILARQGYTDINSVVTQQETKKKLKPKPDKNQREKNKAN